MLPSPLTGVIAQQGDARVLISWDFQAGSSYSVQRSTDQINYTTVASPTAPEYEDTTVTVGVQYWYRVAGVNGSGTGSYSLPVTAVPTIPGHDTLAQIRLQAQQRADRVNSKFVTKSEWNDYINKSYFELYDLLVQKYGNEYYVAPPLEITLAGDPNLDLPNGVNHDGAPSMYKLLGVDLAISPASNAWMTLKKYEFISRNTYVYPQLGANNLATGGLRYRMVGGQMQFIPTPTGGQVVRLWYIPRMTVLLKDTDQVDGVSGWTEYIIIDAAIKALQKEEADVSVLAAQKMMMIARIEAAAENRDAGEPEVISETRRWGDTWGMGDGGDSGPIGGV